MEQKLLQMKGCFLKRTAKMNNKTSSLIILLAAVSSALATVTAMNLKKKKPKKKKDSKSDKAYKRIKENIKNLSDEVEKLKMLDDRSEKELIINALTQENETYRNVLEAKRIKELELKKKIGEATNELLKSRGSDSIDYITEKCENAIQILNRQND